MTVAIRQPDAKTPTAVAYSVTGLGPAMQLSDADGQPEFLKELIYVGNFSKPGSKGAEPLRFSVDEPLLVHWKKTHGEMLANGVQVPTPLEHTVDPEKNRGQIVGMELGRNDKGLPALFGRFKFRDAEAAKLAKSTDVSIYVPPEQADGKGNVYKHPISHVAFTNYPVIPALGKFQAIAASLETGDPTVNPIQTLATQLGLSIDGVSDEDLTKQCFDVFTKLKAKSEGPGADVTPGTGGGDKNPIPPGMAASFTRLLKENREAKLDALVRGDGKVGFITKATRDELAKTHCDDKALALSLSSDGADEAFDSLCEALKKNIAVRYGEQTGSQGVALSNPGLLDPKTNELIAGAEKMAAAK